jgi:hypothetical protein
MFKIVEAPSFKWPVTVHIPKDGGKFVTATFTAEFAALPQDEIDTALEQYRGGNLDSNFATQVLINWNPGQVQDSDGSELPYSDEAKEKLVRMSYVRNAVVEAFFDAVSGGVARRKNLKG